MPYIERERATKNRSIVVVDKYYSFRARPHGMKLKEIRQPKENETTEKQREGNRRRRIAEITMMIANNFEEGCPYLTVTYDEEHLPAPEEKETRTKKDLKNFIARLKRYYMKEGAVMKRGSTVENVAQRGRPHAHLLLSKLQGVTTDREYERIFSRIWGRGRVFVKQYGGEAADAAHLAAYFQKQDKRDGGARMDFSRNCEKPVEHKREIRRSECYADDVSIPPGYRISKELSYQGYTADGYPCQHIVLERDETSRQRRRYDVEAGIYKEVFRENKKRPSGRDRPQVLRKT